MTDLEVALAKLTVSTKPPVPEKKVIKKVKKEKDGVPTGSKVEDAPSSSTES